MSMTFIRYKFSVVFFCTSLKHVSALCVGCCAFLFSFTFWHQLELIVSDGMEFISKSSTMIV